MMMKMKMKMKMMMMMMMMMILLDITNYVLMLPPPSHVSMESVDMRHILRWRPLQGSCNTTVLYSVQFQGEFELTVRNNSWVDAPDCQLTPHTYCDLTLDLGSDSDYNLHVQARCGSRTSAWTELKLPFNRRHTRLTAPQMEVTAVGDAIRVSFHKLPATAVVRVRVWRRGNELQTAVYTMPAEQAELHVAALLEGSVYCVRAQTVLDALLYSSSTDTQCVSITGPDAGWRRPTTLALTVIIMAGVLFAVSWSVIHCRQNACQTFFHKESLPHSLRSEWDIQIQRSCKEAELCEQVHVMQDSLLHLEH